MEGGDVSESYTYDGKPGVIPVNGRPEYVHVETPVIDGLRLTVRLWSAEQVRKGKRGQPEASQTWPLYPDGPLPPPLDFVLLEGGMGVTVEVYNDETPGQTEV
jgi:hypothetical protein